MVIKIVELDARSHKIHIWALCDSKCFKLKSSLYKYQDIMIYKCGNSSKTMQGKLPVILIYWLFLSKMKKKKISWLILRNEMWMDQSLNTAICTFFFLS